MARPTKQGIDYFPMNCHMSDKIEAVESVHGNDGFTVIIKAWQVLYQSNDGMLDCSGVLRRKTLAKRSNITEELWVKIIETCIDAELFDRDLWKSGMVLRSNGVVNRMEKILDERRKGRERAAKRWGSSSTPNNYTENDEINDAKGKGKGKGKENESKESLREECPEIKKSQLPNAFHSSPHKDEAVNFAKWFRDNLAPQSITVTDKILDDWAYQWYLLREVDNRSDVKEVCAAIQWARGDSFWSNNFLTPMKLRTKDKNGVMFIDRFIAEKNKIKHNGKQPEDYSWLMQWIADNPNLK